MAAVVGMAVALAPVPPSLLRELVILPLVLWLPGYAMALALFPYRDLGLAETVVLSMGISLAVAALGGLALNVSPWGLQAGTWAAFLGGLTLGSCAVAARRSSPVETSAERSSWRAGVDIRWLATGACLALTAGLIVVANSIAVDGVEEQPRPGFMQVWLVPEAQVNEVEVGVRNEEGEAIDVSLTLTMDPTFQRHWPSISLASGETWTMTVAVPGLDVSESPLDAALRRLDEPATVLRHARLWPKAREAGG